MHEQTSVSINNDGSIVIHDHPGGDITLHPGNEEEFANRFRQLSDAQKNSLIQALIARKQELPEALTKLFQPGSSQKNIVSGTLQDIENVTIGDKFDIHLHSSPAKLPAELTLNIPKTDPYKLIGRANDLEELHELLNNEDGVVVNALGGIGKTALAQAYVGKYFSSYKHIAWITQTTGSIVDDVLNTKGLISILGVDPAGLEPEQLFEKIILKLRSIEDGPSLLVIDNAEQSLSGHRHLLPGQSGWHLLVTSREELEDFYPKRLGFLTAGQAVELFRQHYTLKGLTDAEIRELVDAVDYHTLTIEILAKTAKVQRYGSAKLKQAIEQDLKANIKVGRQAGQVEKIGSYLSTVFNLSELEAAELWLMKQFACLPAEFHSYELIHELTITDESTYSDIFAETVSDLAQKGWLLYNQETDSYKMHRIIADVVKKQHGISVDDVSTLAYALNKKLAIDEAKDNPAEKFPWIPFGKIFLDSLQNSTWEGIGVLQNGLALVLKEFGDFKGARALLEKTMQSSEANFGPEHPSTAISYSNLALVLRDLGDYEEAKALLEKATRSNEKNLGHEDPFTVKSYSNLAAVLNDLGDYEGARALFEKALQADEKYYGPEHPITSRSYSNLALVLQSLGEYEQAKVLLEKAIRADEKNFGPDHPSTVLRHSNLAILLRDLGDYEGARLMMEKVVQADEKNFGLYHPSTSRSWSNLAMVLKDLGDSEGARALLEKAVESDERNFGPEHPSTARSYTNLGLVLQDLRDYNGAKALLEKAVKAGEKSLGTDHPLMSIKYSSLALVLRDLGEFEKARTLLGKAIESDEKNFGPDHPATTRSHANLGLVLQSMGDHEGARIRMEKAVQLDEKNFGPEHTSTAVRYFNLGIVLKDLGQYKEALELCEKALNILRKTLPEEHLYIQTFSANCDYIRTLVNEHLTLNENQ